MFAAGQCVFACLRKIQIVKYESPGGRYVPNGLWVYARHDVCLPCLLMLSTSDLRNCSRCQSSAGFSKFRPSGKCQCGNYSLMPALVGPAFHTAGPNCKDWQYDWHYDNGNYS